MYVTGTEKKRLEESLNLRKQWCHNQRQHDVCKTATLKTHNSPKNNNFLKGNKTNCNPYFRIGYFNARLFALGKLQIK